MALNDGLAKEHSSFAPRRLLIVLALINCFNFTIFPFRFRSRRTNEMLARQQLFHHQFCFTLHKYNFVESIIQNFDDLISNMHFVADNPRHVSNAVLFVYCVELDGDCHKLSTNHKSSSMTWELCVHRGKTSSPHHHSERSKFCIFLQFPILFSSFFVFQINYLIIAFYIHQLNMNI